MNTTGVFKDNTTGSLQSNNYINILFIITYFMIVTTVLDPDNPQHLHR